MSKIKDVERSIEVIAGQVAAQQVLMEPSSSKQCA